MSGEQRHASEAAMSLLADQHVHAVRKLEESTRTLAEVNVAVGHLRRII